MCNYTSSKRNICGRTSVVQNWLKAWETGRIHIFSCRKVFQRIAPGLISMTGGCREFARTASINGQAHILIGQWTQAHLNQPSHPTQIHCHEIYFHGNNSNLFHQCTCKNHDNQDFSNIFKQIIKIRTKISRIRAENSFIKKSRVSSKVSSKCDGRQFLKNVWFLCVFPWCFRFLKFHQTKVSSTVHQNFISWLCQTLWNIFLICRFSVVRFLDFACSWWIQFVKWCNKYENFLLLWVRLSGGLVEVCSFRCVNIILGVRACVSCGAIAPNTLSGAQEGGSVYPDRVSNCILGWCCLTFIMGTLSAIQLAHISHMCSTSLSISLYWCCFLSFFFFFFFLSLSLSLSLSISSMSLCLGVSVGSIWAISLQLVLFGHK